MNANVYRQRARNLIRALREGDSSNFSMRVFGHRCGTPACVLGHYAARTDLQDALKLDFSEYTLGSIRHTDGTRAIRPSYSSRLLKHFGLTEDEAYSLFGVAGCGDASTSSQAIWFIEDFIGRKWPEEAPAQKLIAELNAIEAPKVTEPA